MSHHAEQPCDALIGFQLGQYVLGRVLGRGRMGVVYLAHDTALLRPTAVKLLAWDLGPTFGETPADWFLDEARHVAQINHPRVVQIYAAARQGDHSYIAMELVDGPSAEALVQREGPLSVERATRILVDVASALQAAHEAGVIHRDVKPANVLVSSTSGVAKLGDFGMALSSRTLQAGKGRVRAGTPLYTAPELWQGAVASPSSDIYSLGATYYHLLTGRPPFPATSTNAVREMHLFADLPDPRETCPHLSEAVVSLLNRAMAKSPHCRFESAVALARDASALLSPEGDRREGASVASWGEPFGGEFDPPVGIFVDSLQFVRQPFSGLDLRALPYAGEPLASVASGIEAQLGGGPTTLALAGAPGTGRSTVLETVVVRLRQTRHAVLIHQSPHAKSGHLMRQLGAVLGLRKASARAVLGRLSERCEAARAAGGLILVVDEASPKTMGELSDLLALAKSGQPLSVAVCCDDSLGDRVSELVERRHSLAPLNAAQAARYVEAWLEATRPPAAPPLLFSPDAQLLLAARSEGALALLNRLALNALTLAAVRNRRVVTSFEAWHAAVDEDWTRSDGSLPRDLPMRPSSWPPEQVLETLRALRAGSPRAVSGADEQGSAYLPGAPGTTTFDNRGG